MKKGIISPIWGSLKENEDKNDTYGFSQVIKKNGSNRFKKTKLKIAKSAEKDGLEDLLFDD